MAKKKKKIKIKKKPNIWNILLLVVILAIAGLAAALVFAYSGKQNEIDIRNAYSPAGLENREHAYADTFAGNLPVPSSSIVLDGVVMHSQSERGLLINTDTNETIFAQSIYDRIYPASITKIMTAIIVCKYGNMSDVVVMEASDFYLDPDSQVSGMIEGDIVTMEQLFYTLVVYSANDAANAIARHMYGSVPAFVDVMNAEARMLGMTGTHFENPHGLHSNNHYTTAYDIYLMLMEAVKYQAFTDAMRLKFYDLELTRADGSYRYYELSSTDKYMTGEAALPEGVYILAGKTGTTEQAGNCLALAVQNKKGVLFISEVLNAATKDELYADMSALLSHIND